MMVVDAQHRIVHVNERLARYAAMETDAIRGRFPGEALRCKRACEPEACANCGLREALQSTLATGTAIERREIALELGVGEPSMRSLLVSTSPVGPQEGVVVCLEDITERKTAHEALRASERRHRDLANMLPQTVFEADTEARLTFMNHFGRQMFEITDEHLQRGVHLRQLLASQDWHRAERSLEHVMRGELHSGREYVGRTMSGRLFPIFVQTAPVMAGGEAIAVCGVISDLSSRKRIEQEQVKAAKLESVGILAGGIAHDFNNILSAIHTTIAAAKLGLEDGEDVSEDLDEAQRGCLRARDLTRQLMSLSKGGSPVRTAASIEEVIVDSARFALRGSSVQCRFDLDEDVWPVSVDVGQMSQVIQNLVINAGQAMPDGGVVLLRARNVESAPPELGLIEGRYVHVEVIDSGVGIAESHLARIFDPYFTTKQKGTGLGLATAYSIVRNHDGYIGVHSVLGQGTRFDLYLPASDEAPIKDSDCEPPVRGAGRILLMDDDQSLQHAMRRLLERLGYEVDLARDGAELVERYASVYASGTPYDLVVMDVTVPGGMGGKRTVLRLREIDPQARAVVSTGYVADPVLTNYRDYGFRAAILKPCRTQELAQVLRQAMTEPA